jgi:hypothetical protein
MNSQLLDLHSRNKQPSREHTGTPTLHPDDTLSQMSYQSGMTFSSLYSGTTRSGHARNSKLFNMKQEKGMFKLLLCF